MPFWDEIVAEVAAENPAVEVESVLIDALCARVVAAPGSLDGTGVLMLEHLGHGDAAKALVAAIERTLADPANHTADLGGGATTASVAAALGDAVGNAAPI